MKKMKTIIWDVDDVLNDLMHAWFIEQQGLEDKNSTLNYKDLAKNPPHEIMGLTINEYYLSIDTFRNSEKGRNLIPNRKILNWFKNEGAKFRHVALTARPKPTVPFLAEWLFHHFGNWIRTFSFILAARERDKLPVYDKSKADFLKWLSNADYYIDDSSENVKAAEEIGITSFLFPQPWNNGHLIVERMLNEISE